MGQRARTRRGDGPLSASVYWPLFRLSPLIMLLGMVSGGWLIIRLILLWGEAGRDYVFGIDIPIAAATLLLWVACAVLLLLPPSSVLARQSGELQGSALVWPLGRRFRGWSMAAVPLAGLLGALLPFPIPVALGADPDIPPNLWLGLPLSIAITAGGITLIWMVLRSALLGVELTPTHLIARGYFVSKRHRRDDIESAVAVPLTMWQIYLLEKVTNREVEHTLQLTMNDGTRHRLFASNSFESDVTVGAMIVNDWLASSTASVAESG